MKVWVIKKTLYNARVAATMEKAAKIIAEMLNEEGYTYTADGIAEHLQAVIDDGEAYEWWPVNGVKERVEAQLIEVEG